MTDTTPAWERVRGFVPVSLCDWPGRISCVLFAGGCNLRCPTCQNADLAWRWQKLPRTDRSTVLAELRRRGRWLDGLTLSGGEPTCLSDLADLLEDLHSVNLPIKVDSNGSRPDILEQLLTLDLAQTLAVDVKGPWERYPDLTGNAWSVSQARQALAEVFALARLHPDRIYFRCTKVPALSDTELEQTRRQVPAELTLVFQDFVPPRTDECS